MGGVLTTFQYFGGWELFWEKKPVAQVKKETVKGLMVTPTCTQERENGGDENSNMGEAKGGRSKKGRNRRKGS